MTSGDHRLTRDILRDDLQKNAFCRSGRADRVGLEVEYFLYRRKSGVESSSVNASATTPERRANRDELFALIDAISKRLDWTIHDSCDEERTVALANGCQMTFEPGGQIEVSTPPCDSVVHALAMIDVIEQELRSAIGDDFHIVSEGIDRLSVRPDDLPEPSELVIGKPRYRVMDEHFCAIGPFGRLMMRSTCSTQINLDFGPEHVWLDRWRVANLIAPLANILFANSSLTLGSTSYRSFRQRIWSETDRSRTGIPDGTFSADPVGAYLEFALAATLLFRINRQGECQQTKRSITFEDWMKGEGFEELPSIDDWHRHLTTLFPDVRPKGFIEIRTLDGLPSDVRKRGVAWIVDFVYNDRLREEVLEIFSDDSIRADAATDADEECRLAVALMLDELRSTIIEPTRHIAANI